MKNIYEDVSKDTEYIKLLNSEIVIDRNGQTALHWATFNGQVTVVKNIITKHSELINIVDKNGQTALRIAIEKNLKSISEKLLANNLDINTITLYNEYDAIVRILLFKALKLTLVIDECDWTVLNEDIENYYYDVYYNTINALRNNTLINFISQGLSLNLAIERSYVTVVEKLIAKNSFNITDEHGRNALHAAVESNRVELANKLLAIRPELINAVDQHGRTALDLVVLIRANGGTFNLDNLESKLINLEPKTVPDKVGFFLNQLLNAIRINDSVEVDKLLDQMNSDDLIEDKKNLYHYPSIPLYSKILLQKLPLHLAVIYNREEIIDKLLIKNPALINILDKGNNTALHLAVINGNKNILKNLLAKNSDIDVTNKEGQTALHLAISQENEQIIELLSRAKHNSSLWRELVEAITTNSIQDASKVLEVISQQKLSKTDIYGGTVLHLASREGQYEIASLLIKKNPNFIECIDKKGWNALHEAVSSDQSKLVELLITEKPILAEKQDKDSWTAIHLAAYLGHWQSAKIILNAKPQLINIKDKNNQTALEVAITSKDKKFIDKLLKFSEVTKKVSVDNWTKTIETATKKNDYNTTQKLLKKVSLEVITALPNDIWYQALKLVANESNEAAIRKLELKPLNNGLTILHVAAAMGLKKVVKTLFKIKSELINIADKDGKTVLHEAIYAGQEEIVEMLLIQNPELVDKDTNYGLTVLDLAAQIGNKNIMEMLLVKKPHLLETDGWIALQTAMGEGHKEIVELIMKAKPEFTEIQSAIKESINSPYKLSQLLIRLRPELIDKTDKYNPTLLHLACEHGYKEAVEILLKYQPELIEVMDSFNGGTVLHVAVANSHEQIIKILLEVKPSLINVLDNKGISPLHWAIQGGNENAVDQLLKIIPDLINIPINGESVHNIASNQGNKNIIEILSKYQIEKTSNGSTDNYKTDDLLLTETNKVLIDLNAQGSDLDIISNGHEAHYWYSIADMMRLLTWARKEHLDYQKNTSNENYTSYGENANRTLLTDPYHGENFSNYLGSDIDRINAKGNYTGMKGWQQMPTKIIIPVISGLHWRNVKLDIDYQSKQIKILFDDPYGKDTFPQNLKTNITQALKRAAEQLIKVQTGHIDFTLLSHNIDIQEKFIDQQGKGENSWDCGAIAFSNVIDYLKINNNQQNACDINYRIPEKNKKSNLSIIASARLDDIKRLAEISGISTDGNKINQLLEHLEQAQQEQLSRVKGLNWHNLDKINNLEPLALSLLFEVLENKRLFEDNQNQNPYSHEELEYAYQIVITETSNMSDKKINIDNKNNHNVSEMITKNISLNDIHYVLENGSKAEAELLLKAKPELIDAVSNNGWTALHSAAFSGHDKTTEVLLKAKPELIDAVSNNGWTALHWAAFSGHDKVIEVLLKAKPELIDAVDNDGWTALHWAASNGHDKVIEVLLKAKPELIDAVDNDGSTALDWATSNGYDKAIEVLLKAKPELIDAVDNAVQTLQLAIGGSHEKVVKILLETKPELINVVDENGKTALDYAYSFDREYYDDYDNSYPNKKNTKVIGILEKAQLEIIDTNVINNVNGKPDEINISNITSLDKQNIFNKTVASIELEDQAKELTINKLDIKDQQKALELMQSIPRKDKHKNTNNENNTNLEKNPMKNQTKNNENIKEIFKLISEGNSRIQGEEDKSILLMGKTGAGKSTLTYLLGGEKLEAYKKNGRGEVLIKASEPKNIKIGETKNSETKIPNKHKIEDITIWDCPGFADTGGIVQEIANGFYIKRLFETSKQLKFVLVASQSSMADKGTTFVETVKQFIRSFNDISIIKDNVSLVVTKVDNTIEVADINNTIEEIIDESEEIKELPQVKEMLSYLQKSIHLFPKPYKLGEVPKSDIIKNIEFSTSYIKPEIDLAKIAISSDKQELVEQLLKAAKDTLSTVVNTIVEALKQPNSHEFLSSTQNKTIEGWLPAEMYYNHLNRLAEHDSLEPFLDLKLLSALKKALNSDDRFEDKKIIKINDAGRAKEIILKVLDVLEEFASSSNNNETTVQKQLVQKYTHVFKQQIEFVKFLNKICNNQLSDEQLMTNNINKAILSGYDWIARTLEEKVKTLKLEETNDSNYYHEAINYLEPYLKHEVCVKAKAQCYYQIGSINDANSNKKEALLYYTKALELDKTQHAAYEKVGSLLIDYKGYKEAIEFFKVTNNSTKVNACYKELIKTDPENPNLSIIQGDYCASVSMYDKANKYYHDALSKSKDNESMTIANEKIGLILGQQGKAELLLAKSKEFTKRAEDKKFYNYDKINLPELRVSIEKLINTKESSNSRQATTDSNKNDDNILLSFLKTLSNKVEHLETKINETNYNLKQSERELKSNQVKLDENETVFNNLERLLANHFGDNNDEFYQGVSQIINHHNQISVAGGVIESEQSHI